MDSAIEFARRVAELDRKINSLSRASQISRSTVAVDGEDMPVPEAIGQGVRAGIDVIAVRAELEEARVELDAAMAALAENLADAEALLEGAESRLSDAETRITDAFGRIDQAEEGVTTALGSAAAAQVLAEQAKTDAATADQAARDAAGLAGSKGEVIYQVSKPTGSRANPANLWIRTTDNKPHTYNGTDWVAVESKVATDAAEKAQEAYDAAVQVSQGLLGKPSLLFSTGEPGSTQAGKGSMWFQTDESGAVLRQWQQTASNPPLGLGSTWQERQVRSEVIANLDVGKLTAGSGVIADLVAQAIAAASGQFLELDVAQLVASDATLGQAVIEKLFAEVVVAGTAYADAFIGGSAIIDGTVTAQKFVAEVLNGQTIRGAYIEAPVIASSPNLGTGANTLADPDFASQVDTAWVASGHTGDAEFVQRDNISWDKSGTSSGPWRARGNVPTDFTVLPILRVTGDVLANHRSAIIASATRTIDLSSQVTSDPAFESSGRMIAAKAGTAPSASTQTKTTYLTNAQVVPLVVMSRDVVSVTRP